MLAHTHTCRFFSTKMDTIRNFIVSCKNSVQINKIYFINKIKFLKIFITSVVITICVNFIIFEYFINQSRKTPFDNEYSNLKLQYSKYNFKSEFEFSITDQNDQVFDVLTNKYCKVEQFKNV
jgi:hypothetical protein